MSIILSGISEVKFYNKETGEEVLPIDLDDIKEDVQKEEELEKLRKQTGYYVPKLCPSCGQYYEGYDGDYELDGDVKCRKCIKEDERLKFPYFAPEIPAYVDGATRRMFTFIDKNDLYDKMKNRLSEDEILVKSDRCIMSQSVKKSYWWVFGYINNYDMNLLNIPKFDSNIYNGDETINTERMERWLDGKDIIKEENNED